MTAAAASCADRFAMTRFARGSLGLAGGLMLAALFIATGNASAEEHLPRTAKVQSERYGAGNARSFDFYVLSLSWSPSYCAAEGNDANEQQCSGGRPYAFVTHGLWPQFERGYPEYCGIAERDVPRDRANALLDIMPSRGLIRYQWRKHGSCSGLGQGAYFADVRAAWNKVAIPQQFVRPSGFATVKPEAVEAAFLEANAGLPRDGIAVTCDRRYLREVRICMTRDFQFRSCPEVDAAACRASQVVMPPVRSR